MYPTLPDRYTEQQNQQHHPPSHHNHHHQQQQQQQPNLQQFNHTQQHQGAFPQGGGGGGGRAQKPNEVTGAPDGNQRYKATLFPLSDEHDVQSVIVQVGIDGVVLFNEAQTEGILTSPMNKISSWQQIDDSMFRIVCDDNKNVPSRELVITADNATTGAMIDSLLSGAFQWCELNSHEGTSTIVCDDSNEWTNLSSDFNVAKRRREISTEYNSATATTTTNGASAMRSGGGIAYWEKPHEHSGWLWKKGETVRMWRRRFFLLKDKHIFWFKTADVTAKTQPRGTIPLSRVDSISPAAARDAGKSHSLTLEGAFSERIGARHLAADSDRERDEWISALRTSNIALTSQHQRQPAVMKSPPPATTSALGNKLKSAYGVMTSSASPTNQPSPSSYRQQPTTSTTSPTLARSPPTISVSTYSGGQQQAAQPELPPLPFQHPGVVASHSRNPGPPQQQVFYTPQGRAYTVDPLTGQSKWC